MLFSSQHGWFIWTPAALAAFVGLVWACRKAPRVALPLLAAVVLEVSLVGSIEHNWHGDEAFGMRMLTSAFSLLGVGLAIALAGARRSTHLATLVVASACAAFTLLFGIQYRLDLVPKNDRLTAGELLFDKVQFATAWKRHRAVLEAKTLVEADRIGEAIAQIERARHALGASREILQAEVAACEKAHDARCHLAGVELDRLLASRLF